MKMGWGLPLQKKAIAEAVAEAVAEAIAEAIARDHRRRYAVLNSRRRYSLSMGFW